MTKHNNNLTYGRGYVYRIQYHIVWCVKYRRKVLHDEIEKTLFDVVRETACECDFGIDAMEFMPDHVHLLINCSPQHFIPTIIKILKGNTARRLFINQQITEYINSQKIK